MDAHPHGSRQWAPARIVAIDLARAIAVVGMLAVHVGPTDLRGATGRIYAAPHGRASLLFVLVAGIGVTLLARSRSGSSGEARLRLLWRAALLLPVGLALQGLDHGANVILQNYAVLFLVAVVAIGLTDRWLLVLAGLSATLGPLAYLAAQQTAPVAFERNGTALTDPALEVINRLVLTGAFPLVTWAFPLLLGMWLGRQDLRARRTQAWLIVGGGTVALASVTTSRLLVATFGTPTEPVGLGHLIVTTAHSQMPLWLVGGTGSAAFVLGLSLVAADRATRWIRPLVALGQLAFTVYVGHLVAIAAAPDLLTSDTVGPAIGRVTVLTVVAVLLANAWRRRFARGPLEALLQLPWVVPRGQPVSREVTPARVEVRDRGA